jgi:hypothetical protein
MDYVDDFIRKLLASAEESKLEITDEMILDAREACTPERISALQSSLSSAKQIVEASHMKLIIESDMNADSIQREERIKLLESWSAKKMFPQCPSRLYSIALDRCLESEIALSRGFLSVHDVLFQRTRSFVYTMIFVLKEYLLPMYLLSKEAIEHTCIFALVAVLLDDAEDFAEDLSFDSPTLFTLYPAEAGMISLKILAYLATLQDQPSTVTGLSMLSITPFTLMAIYQVRAFLNLETKCKTVDTRSFIKMLSECEEKRTWRNHKSHDLL